MAKRDTKQLIITQALNLFSQFGAVGIKDSSLYKHFGSKHEIFESILKEMDSRYEAAANAIGIPPDNPNAAADFYEKINMDDMQNASVNLFKYFLHDDYASKVRRMLTI